MLEVKVYKMIEYYHDRNNEYSDKKQYAFELGLEIINLYELLQNIPYEAAMIVLADQFNLENK